MERKEYSTMYVRVLLVCRIDIVLKRCAIVLKKLGWNAPL